MLRVSRNDSQDRAKKQRHRAIESVFQDVPDGGMPGWIIQGETASGQEAQSKYQPWTDKAEPHRESQRHGCQCDQTMSGKHHPATAETVGDCSSKDRQEGGRQCRRGLNERDHQVRG